MKKNLFIFLLITLIASCKKEKFPNKSMLLGTWIEQNNKSKIVFTDNSMILYTSFSIDTLNYFLSNSEQMLILFSSKYPNIQTKHKILLKKTQKELLIWNLFANIPENENVRIYKKY